MKKSCVFRITEATFFVIEVDQSDYNNKQKRLKMKKKKRRTRNLLATCCGEKRTVVRASILVLAFLCQWNSVFKKKEDKIHDTAGLWHRKKKVGGRWGQDVHKLAHVRRHAEAESRKKESKSTPVYARANQRRGRCCKTRKNGERKKKKGGKKADVNECGFTQQIEWKRQKRRKREFELCWCALTRNNNNVIITIK